MRNRLLRSKPAFAGILLLAAVAGGVTGCATPQRSHPQREVPATPAPAEAEPARPDYVDQWAPGALQPPRIALLLPMSGPYARTAEAVRDGFMAEHFEVGDAAEIQVYDVGDSPEWVLAAYQQALTDGATAIVGPLKKESVEQLAGMLPPVPVIGLNYLDAGAFLPSGFYQFGLAPEDEARAVADDAGSKRLLNAAALVPEGEWGSRVLAALDERLRAWGGRVVSAGRYQQGVSDQKDAIAEVMGVSGSRERHNALTRALGVRTQFEASRRGDIDFVFMAARPRDARVLMPQFRFYRANGLPHYATSLVFSGRVDRELSGLRFCDMPFMVESEGAWATARNAAAQLSSAGVFPRLYALGQDAYRVAAALQRGDFRVGDTLSGASGWLEWGDSSALQRRLECVEIRADGLQPLAPS
ncbi:MAG: penicillin-binding protein activator [Nevskiales bacterium]|nr:penicillin-binding protein activator [Nevskiales bacterium]